jgi:cytochrome c5
MRYTRIGTASWLIALFLIVVAILVAWVRSDTARHSDQIATVEPVAGAQETRVAAADWRVVGARTWAAECNSCHPSGEGRRGLPPLRGHAVELFQSEGGREYLIDILLDGVVRTAVNGAVELVPSHPTSEQLSDERLAAVLNHMLTAWGNEALLAPGETLYEANEISERRRQGR